MTTELRKIIDRVESFGGDAEGEIKNDACLLAAALSSLLDINVFKQDAAAFALYKQEYPESIAESWETVGLPIVLAYREKANIVLRAYLLGEES